VGWTLVKVSEQDVPKLLWCTHVCTSLPVCDVITPTYKHNIACIDYVHELVPSVVFPSISLAQHGGVLSAMALSPCSKGGGGSGWLTWHSTGGRHGVQTGMVVVLGCWCGKTTWCRRKSPRRCMRDKNERRKGGEGGGSAEGEVVVACMVNMEVRRGGESAPPLRSRDCAHNIQSVRVSTGKALPCRHTHRLNVMSAVADNFHLSKHIQAPSPCTHSPPMHERSLHQSQTHLNDQTNWIAHPTHVPTGSLQDASPLARA
jgi:hypothetical protein